RPAEAEKHPEHQGDQRGRLDRERRRQRARSLRQVRQRHGRASLHRVAQDHERQDHAPEGSVHVASSSPGEEQSACRRRHRAAANRWAAYRAEASEEDAMPRPRIAASFGRRVASRVLAAACACALAGGAAAIEVANLDGHDDLFGRYAPGGDCARTPRIVVDRSGIAFEGLPGGDEKVTSVEYAASYGGNYY